MGKDKDRDRIPHEILDFIKHFEAGADMFLRGCCYWFAHILHERFWLMGDAAILYEPVEGHFITRLGGRYYDASIAVAPLRLRAGATSPGESFGFRPGAAGASASRSSAGA